jgi:hypothetical protein
MDYLFFYGQASQLLGQVYRRTNGGASARHFIKKTYFWILVAIARK